MLQRSCNDPTLHLILSGCSDHTHDFPLPASVLLLDSVELKSYIRTLTFLSLGVVGHHKSSLKSISKLNDLPCSDHGKDEIDEKMDSCLQRPLFNAYGCILDLQEDGQKPFSP